MSSFADLVIQLDMALTEQSYNDCAHSWRNQEKHHEPTGNWIMHREYYLSDGGYSRIILSWNGYIHLTSNSTTRAKNNWRSAKTKIEAVENVIRDQAAKAGYPY